MSVTSSGLTETYRGGVSAWECDAFGHLNIAFYVDRFGDAALNLLEQCAPEAAPPGRFWRTLGMYVRYPQELRAGEGMAIRSGIIGAGGDVARIGHEAVEPGTGEVTTVVEHRLAPRMMGQGLPAGLAAAAAPWSAPVFEALALPAEAGPIASGRDRVKAGEADESGELSLTGYVQRFSIACLHVLNAIGMTGIYMRQAKRGFATFETRLDLVGPAPGVGEGLYLVSGLLGAGNSSLRMVHEMRESRGNRRVATFYQAGVHFDLEARRSAPMPAELRAKAAAVRIGR